MQSYCIDYFAMWLFFRKNKLSKEKEHGASQFPGHVSSLGTLFLPFREWRQLLGIFLSGESSGPAAGGCNLSPSSDENTSLPPTHNPKVLSIISREEERENSEWPWEGIQLPVPWYWSMRLYFILFLKFGVFFLMRAIFKVFIEFVTILLLFYVLVFWPWGVWDLSSPTRDRTLIPCIGRRSLNHWTTREVPSLYFRFLFHAMKMHKPDAVSLEKHHRFKQVEKSHLISSNVETKPTQWLCSALHLK